MINYESIAAIREIAPFPWRQQVMPRGQVRVLDASNNEVPLFALTGLAIKATAAMAHAAATAAMAHAAATATEAPSNLPADPVL